MSSRPRLLAADSDAGIRRLLQRHFAKLGLQVLLADSGQSAIDHARQSRPDVVILSTDLVEQDGAGAPYLNDIGLIRAVRDAADAPIIVLRSPTATVAPVTILDAGADDCLDTPFLLDELSARTRRLLHRTGMWLGPRALVTSRGGLEVNALERTVHLQGRLLALTRKEFDLLFALATAEGATVGYDDLQMKVWHRQVNDGRQNLRRLISSLRRKVDTVPASQSCIVGVHGRGYRLDVIAEPASTT